MVSALPPQPVQLATPDASAGQMLWLNALTPLMVYLPFIVTVAQRYQKKSGIGTVVALMVPYAGIVLVAWTVLFIAWFLLGIPLGPGYPPNVP